MCGICGVVDFEGGAGRFRPAVDDMTAALAHRGPDDRGSWRSEQAVLGFRRLAVIDLETGGQPIRADEDRFVIVLNGEIYNYRELRRELASRHPFRTAGDVEVVLRAWEEHGPEALERLDGMFALALWDRGERTLHLARDRFGVKPLYYVVEGTRIAFASEVSALIAGGFPRDRRIDEVQLRHYLSQKYLSPEGSIFEHVRAVPPGTRITWSEQGERRERYWEPTRRIAVTDEPAATRELEVRLAAAVRRQLVADVPVGVFLSGGIDSGLLAAMARDGDRPVQAFSVGFDEDGVADETAAAAATAARTGCEHHVVRVRADDVAADLPRILAALDGPLGDATAVPTWYLSRFARERVTVALAGEGADELFGGYDRQRFDAWIDRLGGLGRRLLPSGMRLAGRPASARMRERLRMPRGLPRQLDWSRILTADEIDGLAVERLSSEAALDELHREPARRFDERARRDPIGARLEADRNLFLVGDLLPKVDRMSMAHSLEVRVPYLDNRLAEFALALPGRYKVRQGEVKWLLRRVAARVLGPEAGARRKQGFDAPRAAWQRGALREVVEDYLSPASVGRRGWFDPAVVSGWVDEHVSGHADRSERLWLLVALEGWLRGVLDVAPREVSR